MKNNAFRFPHYPVARAACFSCSNPASPIGEIVRIERVEGGEEILHFCAPCVRRRKLRACAFGSGSVSARFGVDRRAA